LISALTNSRTMSRNISCSLENGKSTIRYILYQGECVRECVSRAKSGKRQSSGRNPPPHQAAAESRGQQKNSKGMAIIRHALRWKSIRRSLFDRRS
jgi:hypothetical protein